MSKLRQSIVTAILVFLPISSSLAIDMYLPAYDAIAKAFSVSDGAINLSMSIYLLGLAFGQLLYGSLSDKYGRKMLLVAGLSLFTLTSLLCSFATSLTFFLILRFMQAIGACSCIVLSRAIVTDKYHPEKRTKVLALISASNIFSPALAPLFGGAILEFISWRGIFDTIATFGLLMLMGVIFLISETLAERDLQATSLARIRTNLLRILSNFQFDTYVLILTLLYASTFVWVTFSPDVLELKFSIPPDRFGLFFLIPATGSTIGALFTAKFTGYFEERRFIACGLALVFIGAATPWLMRLFHVTVSPMDVVIPIAICFFGSGMTSPQLISGALAPFADIAGFTSSIIGTLQTMSGAGIAVVTSFFYNFGYSAMISLIFVLATLALLALTAFYLLHEYHQHRSITEI